MNLELFLPLIVFLLFTLFIENNFSSLTPIIQFGNFKCGEILVKFSKLSYLDPAIRFGSNPTHLHACATDKPVLLLPVVRYCIS